MYTKGLISIIIPIYNISEYLPACLDSILASTYKNLEIICINDGSTDDSLSIINNYRDLDSRILLIDQKNSGVSVARNKGLQIASGEYISFIDGDDYIHPNMFEILIQAFVENDIDCVKCDYMKTYTFLTNDSEKYFENEKMQILNSSQLLQLLLTKWGNSFKDYVWNGIFKHILIEDTYFIPGKKYQDAYWSYLVYGKSKKNVIYHDVLYYYYQRESNEVHKPLSIRELDILDAKLKRLQYIQLYYPELAPLSSYDLYSWCMNVYYQFINLEESYTKTCLLESLNNKRKICKKSTFQMLKCKHLNVSQKVIILTALFSFRSACFFKKQMIRIKDKIESP